MWVCVFFSFSAWWWAKKHDTKKRARVRVFLFSFCFLGTKARAPAAPLGHERATVDRPLHPFCLLPRCGWWWGEGGGRVFLRARARTSKERVDPSLFPPTPSRLFPPSPPVNPKKIDPRRDKKKNTCPKKGRAVAGSQQPAGLPLFVFFSLAALTHTLSLSLPLSHRTPPLPPHHLFAMDVASLQEKAKQGVRDDGERARRQPPPAMARARTARKEAIRGARWPRPSQHSTVVHTLMRGGGSRACERGRGTRSKNQHTPNPHTHPTPPSQSWNPCSSKPPPCSTPPKTRPPP